MSRILPLLTAMLLILAVGFTEGLWANRWGLSRETELAAARLADLPMNLGEWQGQALDLDPRQVELAGFSGYVQRQYVHSQTGTSVTVLLACGRPGPLAVHTPDICYSGEGYRIMAAAERHDFKTLAGKPQFWTAKFYKSESLMPEGLRISWAWSTGNGWLAPDNPRLQFAPYSVLYKCYVVHSLLRMNEPLDKGPTTDFLQILLPEIDKCLVAADSGRAK